MRVVLLVLIGLVRIHLGLRAIQRVRRRLWDQVWCLVCHDAMLPFVRSSAYFLRYGHLFRGSLQEPCL
jgi:hypothetical protein